MSQRMLAYVAQLIYPKDDESNMILAAFHMVTVILTSMSLVNLNWFTIIPGIENVSMLQLTLTQIFWVGFSTEYEMDQSDHDCIGRHIIDMMRIIILLCFITIMFALIGFFLEICRPQHVVCRHLRKCAIMETCSVFFILAIIGSSHYTVFLLEESLNKCYPNAVVTFGIGFHLICTAGVITSIGIVYSLVLSFYNSRHLRDDDRCLLDVFDEGLETFHIPTPPPPYCLPPPPYTP